MLRVLLVLLVTASTANADNMCYSDSGCMPWQVCTVSLGACESGAAPYEVCTGTCVSGRSWRFVPRVGAASPIEDGELSATFGLEIVPPLLGGHVSISTEYWTAEVLRTGLVATFRVVDGLALSARGDITTLGPTAGAIAAVRAEYFPVSGPLEGVTFARFISIAFEAGVGFAELGASDSAPFAALSLGVWP